MRAPGTPAHRHLPVFGTVRRTFELVWIYRALQFRIALPCILLLTMTVALGIHKMASVPPEKSLEMLQTMPRSYALLWSGVSSVGVMLLIMFSVVWRRFLLINATPTSLIFNKPFRRYLLLFVITYFAAVFGATLLTNIGYAALQSSIPDPNGLQMLAAFCMFVSLIAMLFVVARYLLIFTAATIDHRLKLREAAGYMKGNLLRFAAAWMLIVFATNFGNNLLVRIISALGNDPASAIGSILIGIVTAFTMVITTSLLSSLTALAYDFLVRGCGPESQKYS